MDSDGPKFSSAGMPVGGNNGATNGGAASAANSGAASGAAEVVNYDGNVAKQHIDMNPPLETEPLTGSSVIVEQNIYGVAPNGEPLDENGALPNGFKPGYGPNSAMARIEKPVKPKTSERLKHTFGSGDKKKRKRNLIIFGSIVLAGGIFAAVAIFTGMFETDYSGTYLAAKEVRTEIQKLKSDASCDKVVDYADNGYTSMQVYSTYVEGCKAVGEGVNVEMIAKLGDTEGVLRDAEVRKRFDTFKSSLEETGKGSDELNRTLEMYVVWHEWVVAEKAGETKYATYEWTDADLKKTSDILVESGNKTFKKYGEEWNKRMTEIADLSYKYYHMTTQDTIFTMAEIKSKREKAMAEFAAWKDENEPSIVEVVPLETVDVAKLYANFNELYDYIRVTYQDHYNSVVGGCKEMVNAVVCE